MQGAVSAVALLVLLAAPHIAKGSLWINSKCPGESCFSKPDTPVLDWNGERCICRAHPCWFDKGVTHACNTRQSPYLVFGYHANGTLACGCQSFPHIGSVYVQQDLCPGEACKDPKAPILDFDEKTGSCHCTSHPCLSDDGIEHKCGDPRYPILTYFLSTDGKLQCGCSKKFHHQAIKDHQAGRFEL